MLQDCRVITEDDEQEWGVRNERIVSKTS
ncbi:MAG: hypothetical protein IJ907_00855 [Prevotella sp.]|nr:hypothetical protein [Prevotella sp.]